MKIVRDLLETLADGRFVGRGAELQRMRAELEQPAWRLLHLFGMGGLGKTELLREFCRLHPQLPAYRLQLRGKTHVRIEGTAHGVEVSLADLPDQLRSLTAKAERSVVLIDGFHDWEPLYPWLREQLFPSMPVGTRVVTASRFPLDTSWTQESPWARLTGQMELRPLDPAAAFQYIRSYGIDPFETCHFLARHSRGVPLALQKLCHDTLQHGIDHVRSAYYQKQFDDYMARELLRDLPLSDLELEMLDTASLLWHFDHDALHQLQQCDLTVRAFRAFCRLPIVESTTAGWRLTHFVRYWLRKEFAYRAPSRYAAVKQRAKQYWLAKLETASPEQKRELYLNLLHLVDNEALHTYCFQESSDPFVIRPLPREDLPVVREMFVAFHDAMPAFLQDCTHQEQYLETYWALSPDTFYGFFRDGRLAMFMSMLPLTSAIRQELRGNPVYRAYIEQGEHLDGDAVMWIASFLPEYGASAVGLVFQLGFAHLAGAGRMIVMTPFLEGQKLNDSLGHEQLSWADYTAPNGLVYRAYRLDLRDREQLDAIMTAGGGGRRSSVPLPSREEAYLCVKELLTHYYGMEQESALISRCSLLRAHSHSRQELVAAAGTLRKFIAETLAAWLSQNEDSAAYSEILRLCYIQQVGTHASIAARLNLSLSTYYRHLKKGIEQLAEAYRTQLRSGFH